MPSILSQLKVNVINLVPSYLPDIITLLTLITYSRGKKKVPIESVLKTFLAIIFL